MVILHQLAPAVFTSPPVLFLPAPPKRLALSAPRIAGYLPAPAALNIVTAAPKQPKKRVVEAEIANPLLLIDLRRNPKAWWAEFERIYGPSKTTEELDAEIEAKHPGYLAWLARQKQQKAEAARS